MNNMCLHCRGADRLGAAWMILAVLLAACAPASKNVAPPADRPGASPAAPGMLTRDDEFIRWAVAAHCRAAPYCIAHVGRAGDTAAASDPLVSLSVP